MTRRPGLPAVARAHAARARRTRVAIGLLTATTAALSILVLVVLWRPRPPESNGTSAASARPREPNPVAHASSHAGGGRIAGVPLVHVDLRAISLDGVRVADTTEHTDAGRAERVDGLLDALRRRRTTEREPGSRLVLRAERDVPAMVVKSVFQTAMLAGYTDVELAAVPAE